MISQRRNLTQPADWWDAFAEQAAREGLTLSEWVGECCLAYLSAEVQQGLSNRPPANRPALKR
jgi:hypothetical protein